MQNSPGSIDAGPSASYEFVTDDQGTAYASLSSFSNSAVLSVQSNNPDGDQVNSATANGASANFTYAGEVLGTPGGSSLIDVTGYVYAQASDVQSFQSWGGVNGANASLQLSQNGLEVGYWSVSTFFQGPGPLSINIATSEWVENNDPFSIIMDASSGNLQAYDTSAVVDPIITLDASDTGATLIFSPNLSSAAPDKTPSGFALAIALAGLAIAGARRNQAKPVPL